MPYLRALVPLIVFAAVAACSGPQAAGRPDVRDTVPPAIPVTPGEPVVFPDGTTAAGVAFGRAVPDEQVLALLRRHGVRPYAVYLSVGRGGGMTDVPPDSASLELVARARRQAAEGAREGPCFRQGRLGQILAAERGVRPAPGTNDPRGRRLLAELEEARTAAERLRRGDPAVYGLKVVGREEDVRRLAADPLVARLEPARKLVGRERDWFVPGPEAPRELTETPVPPGIEALSNDEVRARLERYAAEPLPECRRSLRNQEMGEEPVRIPASGVVDGVRYRAETRAAPGDPSGARGPARVSTVLTLTNTTDRPVELDLRGCTLQVRVYRSADRAGPPVSGEGRGQCMDEGRPLRLGPGESRRLEAGGVEGGRLLGDSLPPGRYHFSALFRLTDRTLEVPAGSADLTTGLEGLEIAVRTRLAGRELRAEATVTNRTERPLYVEYGACALRLRAYRAPERSGAPVWRSERAGAADGGVAYSCPGILYTKTLAPGESLGPERFRQTVPVAEILGDSLPDGRYFFTGGVELNFSATPERPAGDAVIAVPGPALPSTRGFYSVTYRAETRVEPGPPARVRTRVTGTLTGAGGALLRYSYRCPVVLYAYRDRARRDAAPRSGAPDWKSAAECGAELQELTLQRGQSRVFEVSATAADILGAGQPPGRYYFAVAVRPDNRAPLLLSAGDAVLQR